MKSRKRIKETLEKVKSHALTLYLTGGFSRARCNNTQDFIKKHIVIA